MNVRVSQVLVVGAGFAGAVHARTLAEAGFNVLVIDKRLHLAGNAYDEIDADGVLVHRYGPHLFHTANLRVLRWVRRFADWVPYVHRVRALLPCGGMVPVPINVETVNTVFGTRFTQAHEVRDHLASLVVVNGVARNAAEHLAAHIGTVLTDLFFRPYTKKMWGLDLEDLDAAVVKRIPLRHDHEDTYFPTTDTQILPKGGYTRLVASILEHPQISVSLGTPFHASMLRTALHAFLSMPIDEFFGFDMGELPYRSIRFHHAQVDGAAMPARWSDDKPDHSVINFTDSGIFTRETAWHRLPGHVVRDIGRRILTREEPCDYRANGMERYYPIKKANGENRSLYEGYAERAARLPNATFIGRCGTYRYLDMDQVINQSLMSANAWLRCHTAERV